MCCVLNELKMDNRLKIKLIEIINETKLVKIFKFKPLEGSIPLFSPGQFVFLYAMINGEEIKRAYSIASSPLDEKLELEIELVENGKMTSFLHTQTKVGDIFEINNPQGHFKFIEGKSDKVIMIAGGTGIAPMRSIIRYCTQKNLDTKLVLFYSSRTKDRIVYKKEFEELVKENPQLKVVNTLTRNQDSDWKGKQGRINKEMILEEAGDISESMFFLCGSIKMVKSMVDMIKEMGVDRTRIKMDIWGS